MKVRIIDAIRMMSSREVAKIIGAVVSLQTERLSAEECLKHEYPATEEVLLREIEITRNQTNAERIRSMSDEELAGFLEYVESKAYRDESVAGSLDILEWLQSETEE